MKFLISNLQKLTQNFNNISSILKNHNLKKKKKIPKPRFQKHECMKCKRIEAYHVKKSLVKLEETCRTDLRERSECLGEKTTINRERYRINDRQIARGA